MKDKKLQVFVSSTFTDLREERQAAVEAILSSGHIPAGMELFAAGDQSQMTVIERWIDESDVYLLILGGRYGSIDSVSGKSYTQLEYEYALQKSKPLFAVVISEGALNEKAKTMGVAAIEQYNSNLLQDFRKVVLSNLVKFFDDKKDIKLAIHETLAEFGYTRELTGWIRGDNSVNTGLLAEQIGKLTKENAELRELVSNTSPTLYMGLTFNEMKYLLETSKAENYENLFEFLKSTGSLYVVGSSISFNKGENEKKLEAFGLLSSEFVDSGMAISFNKKRYKFTNDGHKFYIKISMGF